MNFPPTVVDPPFTVTRASHIVLTVADLAASRLFYEQVFGLVVTVETADALYFRGIEEACHHSLVLRQSAAAPCCERIGLRVRTEDDLRRAKDYFAAQDCAAEWAEVAFQGLTLHVTDPFGIRMEYCAHMPVEPRHITRFHSHRGGSALRIDHYQLLTPDLPRAFAFYHRLGFMLTEYVAAADANAPSAVFLQRKGNPYDLVLFNGDGPRLHHFAFMAPETHHLLHACDIAGELGFGRRVERGPGRHGPGHAQFVYFRDPDGHRVELFNTHYQIIDLEIPPVRWDPTDPNVSYPWGPPARRRWFEEATLFAGTPVREAGIKSNPMTLEKYLASGS